MWPDPQETADLFLFTEEILNGKLHFLCNDPAALDNIKTIKSVPVRMCMIHSSEWSFIVIVKKNLAATKKKKFFFSKCDQIHGKLLIFFFAKGNNRTICSYHVTYTF